MGACISIHHKSSEMKVQMSFDSTDKPDHKLVIHSTHSNLKLPVMDGHVAVKPQLPPSGSLPTFSDYGSKEETFFDSQAWLDSDYEDEFMSVNGEFTPSRGNTPVHHSLIPTRANTSIGHVEPLGSMAQPSPAPRKRLLDFFKESRRDSHGSSGEEFAEPPSKYGDEMGSNKDGMRLQRERPAGTLQGCFTGLLSVSSTGRQKKKSPVSGLKFARGPVVGS
ncbi:hypothetical protein L1987_17806 [Smallanthus sonchifolius]|uniref:Uncharacterized protein n=1 Tax=Smallanthus sonchifolius TaxID=185202 RepID=A0ACB9IYJ6_9ASTR|nr:hypothetical protein L1987_17806 [Smallanthus sonchifolius]